MENKISCQVIGDLIPLVKDGIASPESEKLVLEHVKTCEHCQKLLGDFEPVEISDEELLFSKLKRRVTVFSAFLMFAAMFLGLSLTFGADMFYNSFIMPIVGVFGYIVFKMKAVYSVPFILTGLNFSMSIISFFRGLENGGVGEVIFTALTWSFIYSLFAILGIAIAALYHYAFKRES